MTVDSGKETAELFSCLTRRDILILCRGFAVLAVFVLVGVVAAEKQINNLTQRRDAVEVFDFSRDDIAGAYSINILGSGYQAKALYPVAVISNTDSRFSVEVAGRRWTVPTLVRIDWDDALNRMESWWRQGIALSYGIRQAVRESLARFDLILKEHSMRR